MSTKIAIHKAAGVIIEGRKLLVARSKGKDFFVPPGGKVEVGETVTNALIRELKEELSIVVHYDGFHKLGTYYAAAAGNEEARLQMDVFMIEDWDEEITPDAEIEEIAWINSESSAHIALGSIFKQEVVPALKERGLID